MTCDEEFKGHRALATDALIERIAALETAEMTRSAVNDYCLSLDTGDLALLRRTFADDIVLGLPGGTEVTGADDVLGFFEQAIEAKVAHRKHFNANVTIRRSDAAGASGDSYFFSLLGDPGSFVLAWGRFAFTARRTDDRVRIARLDLIVEQTPAPVSVLATGTATA